MCLTETGCPFEAIYRPLGGLHHKCKKIDGEFIPFQESGYGKYECKNAWKRYPIDWVTVYDHAVVLEEEKSEASEVYDKYQSAILSGNIQMIREVLNALL